MSYSIFTLMNIKDFESLAKEETLIIESWINDNVEALYQQPRIKKRRRFRKGKVNYWDTEWVQLIRSPSVIDPSSHEGKFFKRCFRVEFDLFHNRIVPMCMDRNIFKTKIRIPLEIKILICLRILGCGNCADDISEFSKVPDSTINGVAISLFRD